VYHWTGLHIIGTMQRSDTKMMAMLTKL